MSTPALKEAYLTKIIADLMSELGYTNKHQVPTLEKIVINSCVKATDDKNQINEVLDIITTIAGQKAEVRKSKKSISNFKLRENMPIAARVTLRGKKMWEFLYKLINIVLPMVRDFRGVNSKLDGHGNFTLGMTDHTIFPEIHSDGSKRTIGMDITIVTTAGNDAEGFELLKKLGMPFRKKSS